MMSIDCRMWAHKCQPTSSSINVRLGDMLDDCSYLAISIIDCRVIEASPEDIVAERIVFRYIDMTWIFACVGTVRKDYQFTWR